MQSFPNTYYDERYYSNMAPGNFRRFVESRGRSLLANRRRDLSLVRLAPGMRLLDIGCGRGELVMYCASRGVDSCGIDYSETAIDIGRGCLDFYSPDERARCHLLVCGAACLPFPDSYFDRVMSWATIEHLYQGELEQCLLEIRRVLKPGGAAVLNTHPNAWYERYGYPSIRQIKGRFLPRRLGPYHEIKALEPEHVNVKSPLDLRRDLMRAGLACRVKLLRRDEFELDQGTARLAGFVLESIPVLSLLLRTNIVAFAAQTPGALHRFLREESRIELA